MPYDVAFNLSRARRLAFVIMLGEIDGLGFIRLTAKDVVRHRIVQDIVDAYERASLAPGDA